MLVILSMQKGGNITSLGWFYRLTWSSLPFFISFLVVFMGLLLIKDLEIYAVIFLVKFGLCVTLNRQPSRDFSIRQ